MSLLAGTILQSRYRIIRKLGQGGMGAVYEAFDLHVSAVVAVKETSNSENISLQAFRKEARLLANLHHEFLPLVMDCFHENGGWFFVMEFVEGSDIENLMEERKSPFEIEDVLTWADQILDALEYLHENGIIHLDIKPSNLKLTGRQKIKLLDFGISKGAIGEITTLQNSYSVYGATRRYAPLEQLLMVYPDSRYMLEVNFSDKIESFSKLIDQRSDLFALAMTLYQLLSCRCPEMADLRAMSIWSGKGDNLTPISKIRPDFPPEIDAILNRALALEQKDRFATAAEMRKQINSARKKFGRQKYYQAAPEQAAIRNIRFDTVKAQIQNHLLPSPAPQSQENSDGISLETEITKSILRKENAARPDREEKSRQQVINLNDHYDWKILEKHINLTTEQRELIERNEKKRRIILSAISFATVIIFGLLIIITGTALTSSASLGKESETINENSANVAETLKNTKKTVGKKRRK